MATMQQAIDALNAAATAYNTGAAQIQQAIQQAQTDVQAYIANARAEYPYFRTTPNQRLALMSNGQPVPAVGTALTATPQGFSTTIPAADWQVAAQLGDGSLISASLEQAIGINTQWYPAPIYILRASWTGRTPAPWSNKIIGTTRSLPYVAAAHVFGAIVQVEAGTVNTDGSPNGWQCTADGQWHVITSVLNADYQQGYTSEGGIYASSQAGSILIALPANVVGIVAANGLDTIQPHQWPFCPGPLQAD